MLGAGLNSVSAFELDQTSRGGEITPRLGEFGPKQNTQLAPLMKAEDVDPKQPWIVTIKAATVATIKGDTKPRLSFEGQEKELFVNATNVLALADLFGDIEVSDLVGKTFKIANSPTQYQGKSTRGLRIQAV